MIPSRDLVPLRLFFRSFFLQAAWNLERMQNLGFVFSILPALKRVYGKHPDKLRDACGRHMEAFNSQPYMAALIIGTVARLEEDRERKNIPVSLIDDFRTGAMTAFAAMGDALFWNTLRPLCAASALFFVFRESLWAPLIFLFFYNTVHLFIRAYGLHVAYFKGIGILESLRTWDIPSRVVLLKGILPIVLGLVGAKCALNFGIDAHLEGFGEWFCLPIVLVFHFFLSKRIPVPMILGVALSLFILMFMVLPSE